MASLSMDSADYKCNPTEPGFFAPYQNLRWIDQFTVSMSIMDTNAEIFKDVTMVVRPPHHDTVHLKEVPSQGTFRVLEKDLGWPDVRRRSVVVEIVETAVHSVDPCDRVKFRWLLDGH